MKTIRVPAPAGVTSSRGAAPLTCYLRALSLWQAGEFDLCLRELDLIADGHETSAAILLRGRALIRSGRPEEALECLSAHACRFIGVDEKATHAMLTGAAAVQCGDDQAAQSSFARARSFNAHHTIAAENDYQQAFAHYQLGEMGKARALLAVALRPIEDIVCARAQSLLGWIDVAESDHVSALFHFKSSLETLARCSAQDTHLRAGTLCAIAIAETEMHAQTPAWLEAEASNVRWTANLVAEHVQTLRHIGLAHQRQGNVDEAFAQFIAGADIAPGSPWAMLCYADCCGNALSCGEQESASGFAALASNTARRITWDAVSGEERLALLALAQVQARCGDAAAAQAYRDLYHELPGVPSTSALRHDARLETYARHVDGDIALARGDTARAVELLSSARSTWQRLNYRWRAAEAETALRLSGSGCPPPDGTVARVRQRRTLIASQLCARDHHILRLVVAGHGNDTIGQELHIATRTARNIVNGMYKQFGAHKRGELIAIAVREDPTLIASSEHTPGR
jgi:DNA-binding NarL/FixJ family response regulator